MADFERDVLVADDDEGGRLNATWSRSGKRLIVTVSKRADCAQVELSRADVERFARFLSDSA